MRKLNLLVSGFFQNTNGATAIEYGLLAALVAVGIIAGLTAVSSGINNTFNTIGNTINTQ